MKRRSAPIPRQEARENCKRVLDIAKLPESRSGLSKRDLALLLLPVRVKREG